MIRDVTKLAIQRHSKPQAAAAQMKRSRSKNRKPVLDPERYALVLEEAYSVRGADTMND